MTTYYYADTSKEEVSLANEQQQEQQPDIRPEGMSKKKDDIIQRVAEFVVNSCDSAKYQHKLRRRTKFNSYFAFLDPEHPYHAYYEYLIKSYQYWKGVQDALSANAGQDQEAYAYYQQQLMEEQQQQQQQDGVHPYYAYPTGEGSYANAEAFSYGDLVGSTEGERGHYEGFQPPYPTSSYENSYDPTAAPIMNENDEEEAEEEYELIIENGVQKLVAKKR
ncbi:unnamed protein product [Phytomonas sp. Hart1]|nr:unnamed protein product [Phytomonas sp. Hart1]|eukprot:CCW71878.1 unnamed protein product [Phytomonas sp. isolate Hart1]